MQSGDQRLIAGGGGARDFQVGVRIAELARENHEGVNEYLDAFFAAHASEVADSWDGRWRAGGVAIEGNAVGHDFDGGGREPEAAAHVVGVTVARGDERIGCGQMLF